MAGKRKLQHFAEMATFPHVFQPQLEDVFDKDYRLKGKWAADVFRNNHPIVLELGCGKGEYTVGMARQFPEKNFIGIDIKGARMWRGAKTALEEKLSNVAFLRSRIEFITACFGVNEIDEIWITFPDPQMKDRREKKRLTGPLFIERYKQFLKAEGAIHLKTDSDFFYQFSREECEKHAYAVIDFSEDLYGQDIHKMKNEMRSILKIQTHYEKLFMDKGHLIHYLKFKPHVKKGNKTK
ncbi:MAG: tRNA (guanosine(46)-N7)-methyltransferase TrmB [Verrucomicrobia bacterium]|nr:tRNA (guanosine(46)-N7)-methyltransferase TrmB [Verrucomicrobiota bacterium]|tara:strand:- start:565 stop:1278 length:714 start_codon:yes stop_codon:yes gene_type:complete